MQYYTDQTPKRKPSIGLVGLAAIAFTASTLLSGCQWGRKKTPIQVHPSAQSYVCAAVKEVKGRPDPKGIEIIPALVEELDEDRDGILNKFEGYSLYMHVLKEYNHPSYLKALEKEYCSCAQDEDQK